MRRLVFLMCVLPFFLTGCSQATDLLCLTSDNMVTAWYADGLEIGRLAMNNGEPYADPFGVTEGPDWQCVQVGAWSPESWSAACTELAIDPKVCLSHMATGVRWCPLDEATWGSIKALYR